MTGINRKCIVAAMKRHCACVALALLVYGSPAFAGGGDPGGTIDMRQDDRDFFKSGVEAPKQAAKPSREPGVARGGADGKNSVGLGKRPRSAH